MPLRAKLAVKLKEYRPAEVQVREIKRNSPDVEKHYIVRRGDTLSGVSGASIAIRVSGARSPARTALPTRDASRRAPS
jgi:hypothetical protein